jgi:LPPG:FO 2-phospho-L-lactate transferase
VITVLAGGVGAAKFLRGLVDVIDPASITIIGNTADDEEFYGLHVSPDLDTVVYTLADVVNPETGWGLAKDTYHTLDRLRALGEDTWFLLGDSDLATHLRRTDLLRSGHTLSNATAELAQAFGLQSLLLPMSEDRIRTIVTTDDGELSFQEYFVRRGQKDEVRSLRFEGADIALPAPDVLEAIQDADAVIIAPSNPLVSIAPILAVPGIRDELDETRAPVVAISPIIGGQALKGPADRMMRSLGHEASALGVANNYADFLDVLVLDTIDAALVPDIEALGVRAIVTDTIMRDADTRRALAQTTLDSVLG